MIELHVKLSCETVDGIKMLRLQTVPVLDKRHPDDEADNIECNAADKLAKAIQDWTSLENESQKNRESPGMSPESAELWVNCKYANKSIAERDIIATCLYIMLNTGCFEPHTIEEADRRRQVSDLDSSRSKK